MKHNKIIATVLTIAAVSTQLLTATPIHAANYDDKPYINNFDSYSTIESDSDLTIRWDCVDDADYYFYKTKLLASTPYQSTSETAYGDEYVVSGETSKRRVAIDSDILIPGHYLKVYIEARDESDRYLSSDYIYLFVKGMSYSNSGEHVWYDQNGPADMDRSDQMNNLPYYVQVSSSVETTPDGKHIFKGKNCKRLSLVEPLYWLQSDRDVESTADVDTLKLIIGQFDVLNSYDSSADSFGKGFYYPSSGSTYCTTFARDVANAYGAAIPMYCCEVCGLAKNIGFSKDLSDHLFAKGAFCECGGKTSSLLAFKVSKRQNATNDLYKFMEQNHDTYGWEVIDNDGKADKAIELANSGNLVIGLYSDYDKGAGHIFIVYPTPEGDKMHQVQAGGTNAMSDGSKEINRSYHRSPSNSWITYYVFRGIE